ncbi:transcriptional regulator, partial [Bacillus thuringiensis]|nr:transcriptional regulator [Bacillus thuringiensis]
MVIIMRLNTSLVNEAAKIYKVLG